FRIVAVDLRERRLIRPPHCLQKRLLEREAVAKVAPDVAQVGACHHECRLRILRDQAPQRPPERAQVGASLVAGRRAAGTTRMRTLRPPHPRLLSRRSLPTPPQLPPASPPGTPAGRRAARRSRSRRAAAGTARRGMLPGAGRSSSRTPDRPEIPPRRAAAGS